MNSAITLCLVKFIIHQLITDQSVTGQEYGGSLSLTTRPPSKTSSRWNTKILEQLREDIKKHDENMRKILEGKRINEEISRQEGYARQQEMYRQQNEEREKHDNGICSVYRYGRQEFFKCPHGKSCCGGGCCWNAGILFYQFWYVWFIVGIVAVIACIVGVIKCKKSSKPSTTTQNITSTVTSQATTNSGSNTATRHNMQSGGNNDVERNFCRNFGQSEPLFTDFSNGNTNSNHNSNYITTTHHFDSSNPHANYSTTSTHYSGDDPNNRNTTNQNSMPHSRNRSGRTSPVPRPTAPAAGEGVASDAPPSYFDAVYKGIGERTKTPTAPERRM